MNNELTFLAFINDRRVFKKKELSKFFRELDSIRDFFLNPPDVIDIRGHAKSSKFTEKIISLIELSEKMNYLYQDEIMRIEQSDIHLILQDSAKYPEKLRCIDDPPILLYHKGKLMDFDNCVAITGRRSVSDYGRKKSREISRFIAKNGYTIVSGLALGVDTEAHHGALEVGGKTIAILAGDVESISPKANTKLASDILESGAILSEISKIEKIHKGRFIERNRLISGISECLIVIESNGTGGTKHQVNLAMKQGKKVFVMKPTGTDEDAMNGFREFVKCGAMPFESPDTIIDFLANNKVTPKKMTLDNFIK